MALEEVFLVVQGELLLWGREMTLVRMQGVLDRVQGGQMEPDD